MTYIDILHTKIGYKIITSTMLIFTFCMLTAGCDLIEYHPYDGNIDGPTQVNATNIARIHALCDHKDTIRFILMGDTQRWYDETEDFVNHVNQRNDIDFVIHGGDISDFGMKKEFLWIHDIMDDLHVPYVAIIGNHDILGCGDKIFEQLYGNQNYSFIVNRIKFLCLSTNALEYDYSHPIPDFNYIQSELADSCNYDRTVIAMHAPPFSEQFNSNANQEFGYFVRRFPGILCRLHAHNHTARIANLYDDGILYYGCDNIKKKSYFLFTITPDGYEYEQVYF